MNTLELKGHLLKIIANTEDKSVLEKLNAYMTSLLSKEATNDNTQYLTTDLVNELKDRMEEYKKNPDSAIDIDTFFKELDDE